MLELLIPADSSGKGKSPLSSDIPVPTTELILLIPSTPLDVQVRSLKQELFHVISTYQESGVTINKGVQGIVQYHHLIRSTLLQILLYDVTRSPELISLKQAI